MRILWLPEVLRAAGLQVALYDGWAERGNEKWGPLRGVVCHATASNVNSTTAGDCRVLWVTGSVTAPVPISQLYLGRDGVWTVGATGRCNHVLTGDKGPHKGYGNSALIGIEAANNNLGEPWSPHMLDSYQRGVAAICAHMGWGAGVVVGHREHQTGKSDPLGIDMNAFRARVAALLAGTDTPTEDEMWFGVAPSQTVYLFPGDLVDSRLVAIPQSSIAPVNALKASGVRMLTLAAEPKAPYHFITAANAPWPPPEPPVEVELSDEDIAALAAAIAATTPSAEDIADAVLDEEHARLAD